MTHIQFKYLTPILYTRNLQGTLEFYKNVLGFELDNLNEELGWMHIHKNNVSLMFSRPNEHEPFEKPLCTGSFYFYVDEVEAIWEKLKNTPFVYYGMEDFEYGMREFAIKDNNGYVLQFGKQVDNS